MHGKLDEKLANSSGVRNVLSAPHSFQPFSKRTARRCFERNSEASLNGISKSKRRVDPYAFARGINSTDARHAAQSASTLSREDRHVRRRAQRVRNDAVDVRRRKLRIAGVLETDTGGEPR